MTYLIDGHNLIGKIPWIDLSSSDDEDELIKLLQEFARIRRKKIEVFFDQAPPGYSGRRNLGNLKAVFVPRETPLMKPSMPACAAWVNPPPTGRWLVPITRCSVSPGKTGQPCLHRMLL